MVDRHEDIPTDPRRAAAPGDEPETATDLRPVEVTAIDPAAEAITRIDGRRAVAADLPARRPATDEVPATPRTRRWRPRMPAVSPLAARLTGPSGARARAGLKVEADAFADAIAAALDVPVAVEAVSLSAAGAPLAGFAVPVSAGDALLTVRACPGLCAALVEALTAAPTPPLSVRPDPVTAAVLGHGALVVCDALWEAGLSAPRILTGVGPPADVAIEIRLRVGTRLGQIQIGLDATAGLALVERLASATPVRTSAGPALEGARSTVDVCMGPLRLDVATLRGLRPGDALCPDPGARLVEGRPAGPVFIRSAHRAPTAPVAAGTFDGDRVTVEALALPTPTFMEATVSASRPSPDALPVDVHIVLASLPLTLAEIATLGPGSILEIGGGLPRVRLEVGDRCIATGELVDVDGVLGVRVLEGDA